MNSENEPIFSVVKYIDQFPLGRQRHVLRSHLTLDEAKKLAEESDLHLQSEDVVVEREDLEGVAAEVSGDIASNEWPSEKDRH